MITGHRMALNQVSLAQELKIIMLIVAAAQCFNIDTEMWLAII